MMTAAFSGKMVRGSRFAFCESKTPSRVALDRSPGDRQLAVEYETLRIPWQLNFLHYSPSAVGAGQQFPTFIILGTTAQTGYR